MSLAIHAPSPELIAGKIGFLSPRCREVLECIADGMTRPAIGKKLGISPGAVSVHARQIYAVLELKDVPIYRKRRQELLVEGLKIFRDGGTPSHSKQNGANGDASHGREHGGILGMVPIPLPEPQSIVGVEVVSRTEHSSPGFEAEIAARKKTGFEPAFLLSSPDESFFQMVFIKRKKPIR